MSRLWPVLKFVPATVFVLLAVVWLVSSYYSVGIDAKRFGITAYPGRLNFLVLVGNDPRGSSPLWKCKRNDTFPDYTFGYFRHLSFDMTGFTYHYYDVPTSLVMLLLLPIAVGCLTRFRFRLWMYFVGVGLVAICVLNWRFVR